MEEKLSKVKAEVVRMHNLLPIMDGDNISVNYADRICTTLEMYIDSLQEEPVSTSKEFKDTIREVKTKIAQCNGFNKKNREDVFGLIDSLRPQSQWKPSDEQMKALWEVYKGGEEQAALASLYSDLKKLKL